jgi:hypothetical protein
MLRPVLFSAVFALAAGGCANPVQDAKIEALGEEIAGVDEGEFHRPGQPCTVCHDEYGGAPVFSIAGTIFSIPAIEGSKPRPVNNARVTLTDTTGNPRTVTTNCVGNFFLTPEQYDPQFPVHVVVEADLPDDGGVLRKSMATDIGRERSCGGCHVGAPSTSSPGWVWVYSNELDPEQDPFPAPEPSCQGAANFQ